MQPAKIRCARAFNETELINEAIRGKREKERKLGKKHQLFKMLFFSQPNSQISAVNTTRTIFFSISLHYPIKNFFFCSSKRRPGTHTNISSGTCHFFNDFQRYRADLFLTPARHIFLVSLYTENDLENKGARGADRKRRYILPSLSTPRKLYRSKLAANG